MTDPIAADRAEDMILELQYDNDSPIPYYLAGGEDFVWIEEGLSSALEADQQLTDARYMEACRIVFDWLKATHNINPPEWFVNGTPDGPPLAF